MIHSSLYKKRHNAIVDRIKKAAGDRKAIMEEVCQLGTDNESPDLVIQRNNYILIIDVVVPFNNEMQAFDEARSIKRNKYANHVRELSINGKTAVLDAIVVGELGSWDPANDNFIIKLCSKSYSKIKRIIVSETYLTPETSSLKTNGSHKILLAAGFEAHSSFCYSF